MNVLHSALMNTALAVLPFWIFFAFKYPRIGNILEGVFWHLVLLAYFIGYFIDVRNRASGTDRFWDVLLVGFGAWYVYRWHKKNDDNRKNLKKRLKEKIESLSSGKLVVVPVKE